MAEAVTRIDRIRRGFNRLGWLWLATLLAVALLMLVIGAYEGGLAGEAHVLALIAAVVAVAGMLIIRALGWVIAGFFPDT
jgi:ABC-type xylose transport system permease subunit